MTTTRQQLEDVISRQLVTQRVLYRVDDTTTIDASRRVILAAVDDWAASQAAAAITPPAIVMPAKLSRRALRRFRKQLARALDTTTGGSA